MASNNCYCTLKHQEHAELFPKDKDDKFIYSDVDYVEAWAGIEDAFDQGLTRSIGLSNFNKDQIQRVLDNGRIKPVIVQVK